jgi:hypothetical protein
MGAGREHDRDVEVHCGRRSSTAEVPVKSRTSVLPPPKLYIVCHVTVPDVDSWRGGKRAASLLWINSEQAVYVLSVRSEAISLFHHVRLQHVALPLAF